MRVLINKKLENLSVQQCILFMLVLCERTYLNFKFFCEQQQLKQESRLYGNILDLIWQCCINPKVKIDFELQLTKFEKIIPNIKNYNIYAVYPAVDACICLAELLHALISDCNIEYVKNISDTSLQTIVNLLNAKENCILDNNNLIQKQEIIDELKYQENICDILNNQSKDKDFIKIFKDELRNNLVSNIGL